MEEKCLANDSVSIKTQQIGGFFFFLVNTILFPIYNLTFNKSPLSL